MRDVNLGVKESLSWLITAFFSIPSRFYAGIRDPNLLCKMHASTLCIGSHILENNAKEILKYSVFLIFNIFFC